MIGGKIKKVYKIPDRVSVWVVDGLDELAVDLEPNDKPLNPGDHLWWQDRYAYWTPVLVIQDRQDISIKRIGYSYSVTELHNRLRELGVPV